MEHIMLRRKTDRLTKTDELNTEKYMLSDKEQHIAVKNIRIYAQVLLENMLIGR